MTHSLPHRQRGGTLVGFIVGTLVGLAGALAVAVYVTKVPVPFVDRVISRKASEDAVEAERNKNWNPNAMLGGKAAKPADAPPTAQPDTPAAAPEADAPKSKKQVAEEIKAAAAKAEAAAKPPAEVAVDPKGKVYSSDPLGDLAQTKAGGKSYNTSKAAPEPATTSSSVEPFTYFVQVGAFRTPEDAQAQRAKLALMGLDAKVSEREQSGRTVYRVRMGPYERLSDAEKMKEDLQPSGLETALVRVQR